MVIAHNNGLIRVATKPRCLLIITVITGEKLNLFIYLFILNQIFFLIEWNMVGRKKF